MPNKLSPLLYDYKKGFKFKDVQEGKKIKLVPVITHKKAITKPKQPMRKFIDEKNFIHLHVHSEY